MMASQLRQGKSGGSRSEVAEGILEQSTMVTNYHNNSETSLGQFSSSALKMKETIRRETTIETGKEDGEELYRWIEGRKGGKAGQGLLIF